MKRLLLLRLCLGALLLIGWQRTARPTARVGVHTVPLIQDRRFGYDKLPFKAIGLRRHMR